MNVLTIQVQDEVDDRAARVLEALGDIGKLPRFMDAIIERRDLWTVLCWLEDDLLAFQSRNRWCGATDDWLLTVGLSRHLIEDVPEYTGYGKVQAWLVYEEEWVLTVVPPDVRQHEGTADILVWDGATFCEEFGAVPIASVHFADDSGMKLNRAMRANDLEAIFKLEVGA